MYKTGYCPNSAFIYNLIQLLNKRRTLQGTVNGKSMRPSPGRRHGLINTNQDFPLEAAEPVAYLLSEQFNISCAITKTIVSDRHSPVFK